MSRGEGREWRRTNGEEWRGGERRGEEGRGEYRTRRRSKGEERMGVEQNEH